MTDSFWSHTQTIRIRPHLHLQLHSINQTTGRKPWNWEQGIGNWHASWQGGTRLVQFSTFCAQCAIYFSCYVNLPHNYAGELLHRLRQLLLRPLVWSACCVRFRRTRKYRPGIASVSTVPNGRTQCPTVRIIGVAALKSPADGGTSIPTVKPTFNGQRAMISPSSLWL